MAAIAARARLKRSRSGRREAVFPMFVAEQRQTVWPVQSYTGYLADNVALSLPLVSDRCVRTRWMLRYQMVDNCQPASDSNIAPCSQ